MTLQKSFEHFIDHENRRFRAKFYGEVDCAVLEAHIAQRLSESVLGFDALIDFSDARLKLDFKDSLRLNRIVLRSVEHGTAMGRTALVASAPAEYGANRMLSSVSQPYFEVAPFHTVAEASVWLGWTS